MAQEKLFLFACLCFCLGIFTQSLFNFKQPILAVFLCFSFLLLTFLFLFKKGQKTQALFLFVIIFLSGALYYSFYWKKLARPDLEKWFEKKGVFAAWVAEPPQRQENRTKVVLEIPALKARVLAYTGFFPVLAYGDEVLLETTLKKPVSIENFDYPFYLKKQKIYFLSSYPQIEIIGRNRGNFLRAALFSFKQKLQFNLAKSVSPFYLGFFEALVFGEENNVSFLWKEKLNISGTRHIAAVSGANITILTMMLFEFLLFLGLWRQKAFQFCLVLVWSYVFMIGLPASGVRAALMASFFILAQYAGRLTDPERITVATLFVMLLANPLLIGDIGFQLSFLAFLGLVYLSPVFMNSFKKVPDFFGLRLNLAGTLSAQVFVLPVLLYNFNQLSLVAPFSNLLILPFIPFLTIGGIIVSFLGFVFQDLAIIVSFPFQIILGFILKIINFFSLLPLAQINLKFPFSFVIFSYFFLGISVYFMKKRKKFSFLAY